MVEGKTRGWVEVGVSMGRRGGVLASSAIGFRNVHHTEEVDEDLGQPQHHHAVDHQPQQGPSAHIHVRFHTLCGMSTLVSHVLTSLLDALASTAPSNLPVSQAHYVALNALASDPSALNLYVTLLLVPKPMARQLATDPAPVTSHVAWNTSVPQWSATHAGVERIWHGISDEVVRWMREGTAAVAVGKVWHRFEQHDNGQDEVPDLLVGEFRMPLARLVDRPSGWGGSWFPVHAPRVVGVESGVVGVGAGIAVPKCHKVANVLVDVAFSDMQIGGVGEFACVRVKVGIVADVRSVEIHEAAGKEWEVAVDVGSVFGDAIEAGEHVRAKRPAMWDGEVEVTAAVLQDVLEGKLVVKVFDGVGQEEVGFVHVDTFALAHALLRLVNSVQSAAGGFAHGRVVADRVAFREHVVCPESSEASGLVVTGSVSVRVVGVQKADVAVGRVDEEVQVDPSVSVPMEEETMPQDRRSELVPKEDAFTSHLRTADLITDHQGDSKASDVAMLPIQITIIQASGFVLSRQHGLATTVFAPTHNVYVSFVWSAGADVEKHSTTSFLASSVLTLGGASHVADRHLVTSPAVAPDSTTEEDTTAATWAFTTTVMQSTSRPALQRLKHKKVVVFKLWQQALHGDDDRLIGFAKVDLSPVANGLRELNGWYNITSYRGGVAGQIHVRIRPMVPVPDLEEDLETADGDGWVGQLARSAMISSRRTVAAHDVAVLTDQPMRGFESDESAMLSMSSSTSVSLDVVSLGPLPADTPNGSGDGQTVGADFTSDLCSDDEDEDDGTLYREPIGATDGTSGGGAAVDSTSTSSISKSPSHSLPSSPVVVHGLSQTPATPPPVTPLSSCPDSAPRHNSPSVAAFMTRTSTPTTSSDLLPYRPGLAWSDSDSDSEIEIDKFAHSVSHSPSRYGSAIPSAADIGPSAVGQMREHARAIQAQIDEVVRKFGIHE
ncbi:hypothetical protein BCR44DRAFT_40435 [Catenaria anguillulae PL171]|uniref:C2 domain-containing protein n=1 Tax=Catenaria anguillulae PL171 TaxID=765915 RepID=A0A1Y2HFB6_9FUNG|nr:hypothetical protein BCR44DRAFT_40435 [Catenaria anguillulae PL171]